VVADDAVVTQIWDAIEADPKTEITVDMENLRIEVPAKGIVASFPMDPATQHRFLNGLDDIGITLTHEADITAYEAKRPAYLK
jgi:3-isopropylmalate/(R)-2-methylmalate dehydratase small subunit